MGQAKQRGNYEQRRALSIAKQQELARCVIPTRLKPLSPKTAIFLAAASVLMGEPYGNKR